jgi:AraC-like DNA-binding protein
MLAGLRRRGADPAPQLRALGVPLAALSPRGPRIPLESYAALYNAVVESLDDEAFGLFSQPVRPGAFEFLCRAMTGAATLGEALERATRFARLVLPDLRVTLRRGAREATLEIAEVSALAASRRDAGRVFAFEWLLRLLHGLACWLVGRGLALDRVAFPYPAPPHAADYSLVYTEHATFDASVLTATFDAALLDLPVRRDDADVAAFLEGAPGKIAMLYRRDREIVRGVRALVAAALPDSLALEDAAKSLHVSTRTLHRRLHDEGASFREVKDRVRREVALARLAHTRDSVARIAADLGYSEPSAFFRAFKGWTGRSPTAYAKAFRGKR